MEVIRFLTARLCVCDGWVDGWVCGQFSLSSYPPVSFLPPISLRPAQCPVSPAPLSQRTRLRKLRVVPRRAAGVSCPSSWWPTAGESGGEHRGVSGHGEPSDDPRWKAARRRKTVKEL
ncbi:hypothetical protein CHARACLAT_022389 [Characodon lateralis]|uniref:Uncharacterized protein n=1 Tax=Characodon lateralis TaxID=208331 RepID=A0ABU7DMQ2_9TELE|nr:hypothetical protein [Characodon lateralis]